MFFKHYTVFKQFATNLRVILSKLIHLYYASSVMTLQKGPTTNIGEPNVGVNKRKSPKRRSPKRRSGQT